jgi:membrane protease subunit HflK
MTDSPTGDDASKLDFDGFIAIARHSLRGLFTLPRLDRRAGRLLIALLLVAWAATSIYKVQPDEQGVVLRFGKWVDTTGPGLHFHLPYPFETALFPKVTKINQVQLGDSVDAASAANAPARARQMLTGDENIVEADCAVFWKIRDAGEYLFRVNDPEAAVKIAAEGALREVISRTPIQAAMSDKRAQIADETRDLLQSLLDAEHAGITITQVQLQRVEPPLAVIDAFNDVQRARADQERARNEAEAYANDVLPHARGEAERVRQDAEAYRTQVVNLAQGEANAFLAIYDSYQAAKDVTTWRLYLESVDQMLRKATKVIVDTSGKGVSSVVPYMPVTEFRPGPAVRPNPAPLAAPPSLAPQGAVK